MVSQLSQRQGVLFEMENQRLIFHLRTQTISLSKFSNQLEVLRKSFEGPVNVHRRQFRLVYILFNLFGHLWSTSQGTTNCKATKGFSRHAFFRTCSCTKTQRRLFFRRHLGHRVKILSPQNFRQSCRLIIESKHQALVFHLKNQWLIFDFNSQST